MINIGARGGSLNKSPEVCSPSGPLSIACPEVTAATECGWTERAIPSERTGAMGAVVLAEGAIPVLPLRRITRHTVSSRFGANLLKTNDGCTHQAQQETRSTFSVRVPSGERLWISNRKLPLLESGSTHRKQTTTARSNRKFSRVSQLSIFPFSLFHFSLAIPESRRCAAASDSLSGGII